MKKLKKAELEKLNAEFQEEIRACAEKLYNYMTKFIDNKIDNVSDRFNEVIECEKKCDRLKEIYINYLFTDKRSLPFFVEDRYKIIISLDEISNKSELVARYAQVFPFEFFEDIRKDTKELIKLYHEIINNLLDCTLLMETDFSGAYQIAFEVENKRREAFNLKFKLLDIIFNKKKEESLRINLTWNLISLIYDVISWAEQTSDYLRGLIIKYPSR
ncbi:MAG TPA: DUF47 family protein [Candidatus Lokiarchaeia archaeon]